MSKQVMEGSRHKMNVSTADLISLMKRRKIMLQLDLSFEDNLATRFELDKNERALRELWSIEFWQNYLMGIGSETSRDYVIECNRVLKMHKFLADEIIDSLNPPLEIGPWMDKSGHVAMCNHCLERFNRAWKYSNNVDDKVTKKN